MSAREVGLAAVGGSARRQCAPVAGASSKNPAGLLAVAFVASCCHLKQVWTTFVGDSVRAATPRFRCGQAQARSSVGGC